jgi:hypothetical protein
VTVQLRLAFTLDDSEVVMKWLSASIYFLIAAIILAFAKRNVTDALKRARSSEQALAERNATLQREIRDREQVATALQQSEALARAFQDKLKVLHEVTIELTRTHDIDELHRRTIELGRQKIGFDRMGLSCATFRTQ